MKKRSDVICIQFNVLYLQSQTCLLKAPHNKPCLNINPHTKTKGKGYIYYKGFYLFCCFSVFIQWSSNKRNGEQR